MERGITHFPGHWKEYKQVQIVSTVPLRKIWSMADIVQEKFSASLYHYAV